MDSPNSTRSRKRTGTEDIAIAPIAPVSLEGDVEPGGNRLAALWRAMQSGAPSLVYTAVGIVALGFVVIAFAWGQVAGETEVYRQMPYVVSGGLVGLALVMVGVTLVNIVVRQAHAVQREKQTREVLAALDEVKKALIEVAR